MVLATLGMGDAFSARTALDLLSAHVAAAAEAGDARGPGGPEPSSSKSHAHTAASSAAGRAGAGGRHSRSQGVGGGSAAQPPLGPCQVVAVVASPQVELLTMNAALFGLVVGSAGRAMARAEVQDVLQQVRQYGVGARRR